MRMRFLWTSLFMAAALAAASAACDSGSYYGYGYGPYGDACGRFASCGECTPVMGCGWCSTSDGKGLCSSDPDNCASASAFSWTWSPSGCTVGADASVVPVDASPPTPTRDAGVTAPDVYVPTAPDSAPPPPADAGLDAAAASD